MDSHDEPRVESERKVVRGFQTESERNPSDSGSRSPGRDRKGGSFGFPSRAREPGEADRRAVTETRGRYFSALDWAKRNVPDEHAPFAASAATTLRHRLGRWPSADQVRARLTEQGRDMASLEKLA